MTHRLALLLALSFVGSWTTVIGCAGCQTPPPSPPPDAGGCKDVCAHLRALSCPAGAPTQEGHSCDEVCENLQTSGIVAWNLGCMGRATSCPAVETCNQ